jgi:hypothetical protein
MGVLAAMVGVEVLNASVGQSSEIGIQRGTLKIYVA